MHIKDFDSNGLIFALDQQAMNITENNADLFEKALLNILTSQKFSCLPLLNGQRVRLNTNDLCSRAVYKPEGGEITGLVRVPYIWETSTLEFFTRKEVQHVPDEADLVEAVKKMFQKNEDGRFPMMVTVGGTPERPTAIFSEHQLLSEKTKAELYRQLSWFAGTKIGQAIPEFEYFVNEFYLKISERTYSLSQEGLEGFSKHLTNICEKFLKSEHKSSLGTVFHRASTSTFKQQFGNLKVGDIMQHACVGIRWVPGKKNISEQPEQNRLARKMLCEANDFTHLAVYDEGGQLNEYVISRTKDLERQVSFVNATDPLADVVRIRMIHDKEFLAVVRPDPDLVTGEGPMMWPAIVTEQELKSHVSLLNSFATASAIEYKLKELIFSLGLHTHKEKLKKEHNKGWAWMEQATLGNVISVFKYKPNELKLRQTINDFDRQLMLSRLSDIKDLRNRLGHGALRSMFDSSFVLKGITTTHFLSLYGLQRQLLS